MRRIKAARRERDNSVNEQVLDGIALAVRRGPATLPASMSIGRPAEPGNSSPSSWSSWGMLPTMPETSTGRGDWRDRARESGITIASVAIDRSYSARRRRGDPVREQWRTLAEGSYRPPDREKKDLPNRSQPIQASSRSKATRSPSVSRSSSTTGSSTRGPSPRCAAEAEGRLGEYVNSQGLTLDRVAPVLVDLHRGDAATGGPARPRFDGRKAPSVRRGWIAESIAGPMVGVDILMSRDELETCRASYPAPAGRLGHGADLADLIQIGRAAASGETSFLAADRGSRTFAEHLRRRQGLPPARPGSLLARSQKDLLRSDELTLAALDARLRSSVLQITRRLQSPDWNDPKRTIDGMALVPFEFIDF